MSLSESDYIEFGIPDVMCERKCVNNIKAALKQFTNNSDGIIKQIQYAKHEFRFLSILVSCNKERFRRDITEQEKRRQVLEEINKQLLKTTGFRAYDAEYKSTALPMSILRTVLPAIVAIPLFLLSWFGRLPSPLHSQFFYLGVGVFTLLIMIISGYPYYKKFFQKFIFSIKKFRMLEAGMESLIVPSTVIAFIYSMFVVIFPSYIIQVGLPLTLHFGIPIMILFFTNLSKLLTDSLKVLMRRYAEEKTRIFDLPTHATVIDDDKTIIKPIHAIKAGDKILILPGEMIPVDGKIAFIDKAQYYYTDQAFSGNSHIKIWEKINELESVTIKSGCVFQGAKDKKNQALYLIANGEKTELAKLQNMLKFASQLPMNTEPTWLDTVSDKIVWVVLLFALFASFVWSFFNGFVYGLIILSTILSVICPCTLKLAEDLPIMIAKLFSFRDIRIFNDHPIQHARHIGTAIFDVTGTLTTLSVEEKSGENFDKDALQAVVLLEHVLGREHHPITKAILDWAKKQDGIVVPHASREGKVLKDSMIKKTIKIDDEQVEIEGKEGLYGGIIGKVNGDEYVIGSQSFVEAKTGLSYENGLNDDKKNPVARKVYIARKSHGNEYNAIGFLALRDTIREDAQCLINSLKERNVDIHLLSGAGKDEVMMVAKTLHLSDESKIKYQCDHSEKMQYVADLLKNHSKSKVIGVGDGTNDNTWLFELNKKGHIGASLSDTNYSDCTVSSSVQLRMLPDVLKLINISIKTQRNATQNIIWVFVYNSIILLAAVFAQFYPGLAAASMLFSSLFIFWNGVNLLFDIMRITGRHFYLDRVFMCFNTLISVGLISTVVVAIWMQLAVPFYIIMLCLGVSSVFGLSAVMSAIDFIRERLVLNETYKGLMKNIESIPLLSNCVDYLGFSPNAALFTLSMPSNQSSQCHNKKNIN